MTEVENMAGNITKNGGQPGCIKKEKSQDPIGRFSLNRRLNQGKLEEEGEGFTLFNWLTNFDHDRYVNQFGCRSNFSPKSLFSHFRFNFDLVTLVNSAKIAGPLQRNQPI